jgi:DNA helicase-2/ATP-dependent DNA helicase PcrA
MFYADLHVHSRFSRATSRDADLEHLALWAGKKGIAVVATGDFTHPAWLAEIEQKLVPAEPGLFQLRPELQRQLGRESGGTVPGSVRFMLEVEISTIYKRGGRTRKVHHLVYVPELAAARRLIQSLSQIGNLNSDGRPILGLDSRDLLEMVLQSGQGAYLVPAHAWTPWFAVLGSMSGFDAVEECYADLSHEVFALETGLSSDPAMNRRLSALDRYALVSNSDAHSPAKLGREACVFDTAMDYFAMRRALQAGEGYRGTVEFFPEEGKYHLDGHRKCGICLEPHQTRQHGGKCPVCGKPVTLGVMYRVTELADRELPFDPPQWQAAPFRSLIPLDEVLSELLGVGPQSNVVRKSYEELLARLGPELCILEQVPPEDVARAGWPLLAEAIARMREGRVIRQAGFDGQYGTIRVFTREELVRGSAVGLLFEMPGEPETPEEAEMPKEAEEADPRVPLLAPGQAVPVCQEDTACAKPWHTADGTPAGILDDLDPDQRRAAEAIEGPVLIVAGPGTGKTRTLTHRLALLVAHHGVPPEQCLALTFSRRAAGEMIDRLARLLPERASRVPVMTFHALGLLMLREHGQRIGLGPAPRVASQAERVDLLAGLLSISPQAAAQRLASISRAKRCRPPGEPAGKQGDQQTLDRYHCELRLRQWLDFDDLLGLPLELLKSCPELVEHYRARWRWVSVDEYQDLDAAQYELVRWLVPPGGNLCAIGDPDQAIYGFRGADVGHFQRFTADFPNARVITLGRNYRSTQTIVDAATQMIGPASLVSDRRLEAEAPGPEHVEIHACTTERAEAEFVVHTIERMMGGSTFFSLDSQRAAGDEQPSLSFSDFAVLYRTESQAEPLVEALARSGMPFQKRSHAPLADRPWVQPVLQAMRDGQAQGPAGAPVANLLEWAASRVEGDPADKEASLPALRLLAARYGTSMEAFLSELALGADVDLWDPRADRISLLTLHASKGLEFPVVFIVGCEDGLIPLCWGAPDEATQAEERRLLFVGMTRARQHLLLTHAAKRRWRGTLRPSKPSSLLDDIQRTLLAWHQHRAVRKPASLDRQRSLFE